jgi:hypothetical protein
MIIIPALSVQQAVNDTLIEISCLPVISVKNTFYPRYSQNPWMESANPGAEVC